MVLGRIVIDDIRPRTPAGFPAKAVVGEAVTVSADVFRDGHDALAARVKWRPVGKPQWATVTLHPVDNDRWAGVVEPTTLGRHEFVIEAWTDAYATWAHRIRVKTEAGQDVAVEQEEGARLLEVRRRKVAKPDRGRLDAAAAALRAGDAAPALDAEIAVLVQGPLRAAEVTASRAFPLWVDRERALAGAWYELFPRSEGGLAGTRRRLQAIADMGFDVVYLPPIHPIGTTARKGPGNRLTARPGDPGSPWAIGGRDGGHTTIHPELGSLSDFEALVERAHELGMEIALDYALQCSPDHPWVRDHPEWFHHRPDGTIAHAENPPKKYQDIYPINFWPERDEDRRALWEAAEEVLDVWISRGVRVFRVDNPHTKPLAFWEWLIPSIQTDHPDVVFLAEAFTRPKMMHKLAEVGFSQSYTYFTWRTSKDELASYLAELTDGPAADYFRPTFWPNTPDILAGPLRRGPPAAFRLRLLLAATMVPSYGIYSGFELSENVPASEENEEYAESEKYEVKHRRWDRPDSLAPLITTLNQIRRRHPALQRLRNAHLHHADNDAVIAFSKRTGDDVVLVIANLDPHAPQEATIWLDLGALGLPWGRPLEARDDLSGQTFSWTGPSQYVRLDPTVAPAHVIDLRPAASP